MENTIETKYITLTKENIDAEHICCAFSDKKCSESYEMKKAWLKKEFDNGYVFRRMNARAKVFIEYVSAEKAWIPVDAPGYLMINCFWVSGQYKGQGHAKALLQSAIEDAKAQDKNGMVTVVGTKKFHFMSDTKWLLTHGFESIEELPNGFSLLVLKLDENASNPSFKESVKTGECEHKEGLVVYYTNRCPFTDYYVNSSLRVLAQEKNIPLTIIKLETMEQAQVCPSPATIFSAFYNGKFLTTDMSICTESKFKKIISK
jgi:predicted GNAT family acetyltransferase